MYPFFKEANMLTIKIEEIEHSGLKDLVGFTEDLTSFLHLSEEAFVNAKKNGTLEQVDQITKEYYVHLKKTEESRKKTHGTQTET
jgi:hypothetical protein